MWAKWDSIHRTGMARQLSQYRVLVKKERRTTCSSSLPPASLAVGDFGFKGKETKFKEDINLGGGRPLDSTEDSKTSNKRSGWP